MKSAIQIIAEHLAEYAVDEPGSDEWKLFRAAAMKVIEDLERGGYVLKEPIDRASPGMLDELLGM